MLQFSLIQLNGLFIELNGLFIEISLRNISRNNSFCSMNNLLSSIKETAAWRSNGKDVKIIENEVDIQSAYPSRLQILTNNKLIEILGKNSKLLNMILTF